MSASRDTSASPQSRVQRIFDQLKEIEAPADDVCANCTGEAADGKRLRACGACRIPRYCSKQCQRADWKKGHKSMCKDMASMTTQQRDSRKAFKTADTCVVCSNAVDRNADYSEINLQHLGCGHLCHSECFAILVNNRCPKCKIYTPTPTLVKYRGLSPDQARLRMAKEIYENTVPWFKLTAKQFFERMLRYVFQCLDNQSSNGDALVEHEDEFVAGFLKVALDIGSIDELQKLCEQMHELTLRAVQSHDQTGKDTVELEDNSTDYHDEYFMIQKKVCICLMTCFHSDVLGEHRVSCSRHLCAFLITQRLF